MRARLATLFGVGLVVTACAVEDRPPSTPSSPVTSGTAPVGDLPPPPEPAPIDPGCTAIATAGTHLIGLQHGCVPCGTTPAFVELSSEEHHDRGKPEIIRTKCASSTTHAPATCTVIFDVIGREILRRAAERGVSTSGGIGIERCAAGPGYYVSTDDPRAGAALQRITRDVMTEWKIRGTIHVEVAPMRQAIPL